jgi:NAD-dependent SIR2 family protein deacetylase
MKLESPVKTAAAAIAGARSLVITAGAGMGVDSGLPDFRGPQGFWKAYPPYKRLGIDFVGAANPAHFEQDPAFGWGFYGHRTNLYRDIVPHAGFHILRELITRLSIPTFVVTSNVDGQFQKAGFVEAEILEVHGSIHQLQCSVPCSRSICENREQIPVDTNTMRAERIPRCIRCGAVARPNILMFGDWSWISDRSDRQRQRFEKFIDANAASIVVLELGAGTAIPTLRNLGEQLGRRYGATMIRINPREAEIDPPHVSLALGALDGLRKIAAAPDLSRR